MGLNYWIQVFNEFKDIVFFVDFEFVNYNDFFVKVECFVDQLVVGYFYIGVNKEVYFDLFQCMEEQFDECKDVYFLIFCVGMDIVIWAELVQLLFDSKVEDFEQFFFLYGDVVQIVGFVKMMKFDGVV